MLDNIKTQFSIKDLENFTGIKSHTLRIWEKRYKLLTPNRTDTNIRYYDSENFMKLLNINLLYSNGFKISKIAQMSDNKLLIKVKELVNNTAMDEGALNEFKLAMLNFDAVKFNEAYDKLINYKSFSEIFRDVFIPLLETVGFLWQTKSIKPVHEHFISNLILQKIQINIDKNRTVDYANNNAAYILFLPEREIHELGLLYLHYELTLRGLRSIYLGHSISLDEITDLKHLFPKVHFISYFTVEPVADEFDSYIERIKNELLENTDNSFWFLGKKSSLYSNGNPAVQSFNGIGDLLKNI